MRWSLSTNTLSTSAYFSHSKFPSVQSLIFELRYQKANFCQGKIFEWCVSISTHDTYLDFPDRFRNENCACTLGLRAPATFSESEELSCACLSFPREKFTEPTRYAIFSFRNIKVHARPRRWVLTHSVMLDLTVKSGNIGAVICSASCRTSADRCQNLRFGDSNFRLWCPARVNNTLRPSSPIIRRSKIAFCRTQRVPPLRDLMRFPTSASLCVTLDYPLRHGQPKSLKTQAVTSISPSSSLRIC